VDVARDCPQSLRAALSLHPALSTTAATSSRELLVTCSTTMADEPGAQSEIDAAARIHFVQGPSLPVASEPVWLPGTGLSGSQQIPTDLLRSTAWPQEPDSERQKALLLADNAALILISRSQFGRTASVQTVIDFQNDDFAAQASYVELIATLVDAAVGRSILDAVIKQSRDVRDIVIRPQTIGLIAERNSRKQINASTPLYELLLLIGIVVIALDTFLLLRHRRRTRHA
jgi:hypothetical protein